MAYDGKIKISLSGQPMIWLVTQLAAFLSRPGCCGLVGFALGLDLLFDLTPIARRGSRLPETAFGGLLA